MTWPNIIPKFNRQYLEKLEKFFFGLFLLSIPLQTRLTFLTPETYSNGTFNEYVTFFIYFSDLVLIVTFLTYLVNRLTKTHNLGEIRHKLSTFPQVIPIFFAFALILWTILSISWTDFFSWTSYKDIAFYKTLKLTELVLLFIYASRRFSWFGAKNFFILIFIGGSLESLIGILQYAYQHSLGLRILGESLLNPSLAGVAKIVISGERIIRAYGTFPHPNIFGAFLILSLSGSLWLILTSNTSKIRKIVSSSSAKASEDTRGHAEANGSGKMAQAKQNVENVSRETFLESTKRGETISSEAKTDETIWIFLLTAGSVLQVIALILTFSRLAWFGLLIIFILFVLQIRKTIPIVSRAPFVVSVGKRAAITKQNSKIVSRETILESTKEGETVWTKTGTDNTVQSNPWYAKLFHARPPKLSSTKEWLSSNTINKLFHVKQFIGNHLSKAQKASFTLIFISFIIAISTLWTPINNRVTDNENKYGQSIDNRVLYNNIAIDTIRQHPLKGVGFGNFTLKMNSFTPVQLEYWQYQPAHNIYLLMTSELGIIGLVIFLLFVFSVIKMALSRQNNQIVSRETIWNKDNAGKDNSHLFAEANGPEKMAQVKQNVEIVSRETILLKNLSLSILIAFLVLGLFDHYFWTLQQGQLIFWLLTGLLLSMAGKSE